MTSVAAAPPLRLRVLPGVFKPHSDTRLLAGIVRQSGWARGAEVLDLCTGSGAVAVAAARSGARRTTAVDISRRAVLCARLNARRNAATVRVLCGDLLAAVAGEAFDLILSNPPYLPSASPTLPDRGPQRAWEAGRDGRVLLDRICREAPAHLRPGGRLVVVHSSLCGTEDTLDGLRAAGLDPRVLARRCGPLGPLLSARATELERAGILAPGQHDEELVVIEGRRGS